MYTPSIGRVSSFHLIDLKTQAGNSDDSYSLLVNRGSQRLFVQIESTTEPEVRIWEDKYEEDVIILKDSDGYYYYPYDTLLPVHLSLSKEIEEIVWEKATPLTWTETYLT